MSHDVAYDIAFAKQALILAGERLDRVEDALALGTHTKPAKPKCRKARQPKPVRKREATHA